MISTDTGGGRLGRLQPRNWTLPVKLTAVLAVPVILALCLGALRIADQIHSATKLGAQDRLIAVQDRASTLIGQLQRERDQSGVFVAANRTGDRAALKNVFGAVDGALAATDRAIGDPATLGGGPETSYRQAKGNLGRLSNLRDEVNTFGGDPEAVIARYTGLIEPLLVFESAVDRQLNSAELVGSAAGLTALNAAREQISLQHAVIAVAITRGVMSLPDAETVRATDARLATAIDQFRAGLDASQQQRLAAWTTSPADSQRQRLKQAALSRVGAPGQLGISQGDWDSAYQGVLGELRASEVGLRREMTATSAAQQEQARNAAGLNSVILLLSMIAAAMVVYLIGRSMLKPLQVLRRSALDVADRRLPEAVAAMREGKTPDVAIEPVPVTTKEEIGQVARAFDAVHGQAVRLAAEQANLQSGVSSMFVNLSRRSQGLVERQLKLIEQLERNEQDSEQLANLFQLDHLATRMRRNSENLLVLAGSDLGKRNNQSVPVIDVLRAAVSETEQYQRVVVQTTPDLRIMGRAASDLVHLVAELLDNATSFSPPDTQVVVSSTRTPDGSVLMEIADQGVGMSGEELISANNRLSGPAEVNVSASRRMGLFVVGRLASRHGIGVRLASSDPGRGASSGVTASVNVPNYLISGALTNTQALEAVRARKPETAAGGETGRFGALPSGVERNGLSQPPAPGAFLGAAAAAGAASSSTSNGPANQGTANGRAHGASDAPGSTTGLPTRKPGEAPTAKGVAATGAGPADTAGSSGPARPSGPAGGPGAAGGPGTAGSSGPARPSGPAGRPGAAGSPSGAGAPPAAGFAGGPPAAAEGHSAPKALPRRSAGASLAGPLARTDDPASSPSRMPPPGREPFAAPTGARPFAGPNDPSREPPFGKPVGDDQPRVPPPDGPLGSSGPRPGALRSPAGLRSLRTPSTPGNVEPGRAAPAEGRPSPPPGQPPPGQPSPATPATAASGGHSPIFEEMASAWFRENWDVSPSGRADEARLVPAPEVPAPPLPPEDADGWGPSAAWDSGEPLLRPLTEPSAPELTSAGLPRRRRGSQLIQGGGASGTGARPTGASMPSRSAEQVRGRLASYQQGVRAGRQHRLENDPRDAHNEDDSAGEEG